MGQKTNPIGLRVAVNKDWRSKWYAEKKEFGKLLTEDREIRALLESHGFTVERTYNFNRAGTPPWFLYSRVFGSRKISKLVLKVFDKTVWIWRRIDWLMPWRGLSLILVARKSGTDSAAARS